MVSNLNSISIKKKKERKEMQGGIERMKRNIFTEPRGIYHFILRNSLADLAHSDEPRSCSSNSSLPHILQRGHANVFGASA